MKKETEVWSPEARAVMETVGLSKPLPKKEEVKPQGHDHKEPDCPFCAVAPDGKAKTGAELICSTSKEKGECMDVLVTLADVPDKKTYAYAETRLKEVAGENDTTTKFLREARKIWWGEKTEEPPAPPPKKE